MRTTFIVLESGRLSWRLLMVLGERLANLMHTRISLMTPSMAAVVYICSKRTIIYHLACKIISSHNWKFVKDNIYLVKEEFATGHAQKLLLQLSLYLFTINIIFQIPMQIINAFPFAVTSLYHYLGLFLSYLSEKIKIYQFFIYLLFLHQGRKL